MRSPVSTPAGTFTDSTLSSSTRPLPWQVLQGLAMIWPRPPQLWQACCMAKMPRWMRTWPRPWHTLQVSTLPSSEPLPSQSPHSARVGISMRRSTPRTASSRSSSIP
jgi:hypothetical protein